MSIARELPKDISVEVAYIGRRGRKLLLQRDLAMPLNLKDPISGVDYFSASQQLIQLFKAGTDILSLGPIPYWENLFPGFGPSGVNAGQLVCDPFGVDPSFSGGFSATQVAHDWMNCLEGDYTVFPWEADGPAEGGFGFPDTSIFGLFAFFDDQFAALNAWSSIGRSEYHGMQLTVRKRLSSGTAFAFNYTFSKSLDHQSEAERAETYGGLFTGGYTGFIENSC